MHSSISMVVAALAVYGIQTYSLSTALAEEAPALAAIKDPSEKARIKSLVDSARKKGVLSWIGVQFDPPRAAPIIAEFKRYYGLDNLRVDYTYAGTAEIVSRIEQNLRDKNNSIDIVWTSSWAWYKDLLKRGEIMKYESPYYKDYTLSDKNGMSEPGYWVSDAYTFVPLYKPSTMEQRGIKDFRPTTWAEFVDPRLAGQTSMIDVLVSTAAAPVLAGVVKALGDDWLKKLGSNNPSLHTRGLTGREMVGSGEIAVTLFSTPADALTLLERKIEVKQVLPREGVVLIPFTPIILSNAPHPSAAKLFIDFVRSPHGTQVGMADTGALLFFGRPGVKPKYPDLLPPTEEVRVIPFDWGTEGADEAIKRFREKALAAGIGTK